MRCGVCGGVVSDGQTYAPSEHFCDCPSMSDEELLDAIAPREDEESTRFVLSSHDLIQGCASCGYDPDFCACGEYPGGHLTYAE